MKKFLIYTLLILAVGIIAMVFFSPYKKYCGNAYNSVTTITTIKAPVAKVFAYLGNSGNASKWSTYVHHITPLNSSTVPDGSVGCIRRCYKEANEQGIVWDELTTLVTPLHEREINIFNAYGFPIFAKGLATRQEYYATSDSTTELRFALFFKQKNQGILATLKMHFAAYTVKSIFEKNLANIKRLNEQP